MQQFNLDPGDVNELKVGRGQSPPIVEIRDEFARLLAAGEHPRLEACLEQVEPGLRAELLTCLLPLEIAQCQRDGQKYSLAQYLDRFPEYPEIVQGAFRSKSTQVGGETVATTPEPQSGAPAEHLPVRTLTSEDFEERFRDITPIGRGAQAIVYRALDQRSRTIRALKILLRKSGQTAPDPEIVLQNEAQRLSSLRSRGARVLRFIDIGKMVDGTPYMVLEYHHRGSLRTMLDARDDDSPPPWQKAVEIAIDLAETLAVVHAQAVIHFDVKPDNILIDTDGRPVLCDFAAAATHEDFVLGAPIGITDIYSAPECRRVKQDPTATRFADGRSDLFSLGVVFYELLTGKQVPMQFTRVDQQLIGDFFGPLINSASQVVSSLIGRGSKLEQPADPAEVSRGAPLQPPNQLLPGLPKAVNEICLEMLEWSIEDRISTATEVAQRLKAALRRDANPPIKQVKTAAMWGGYLLAFYMFLVSVTEPAMTGRQFYEKRGLRLLPTQLERFPFPSVLFDPKGDHAKLTGTGFYKIGLPKDLPNSFTLKLDLTQQLLGQNSETFFIALGLESSGGLLSFQGIELSCSEFHEEGRQIEIRGDMRTMKAGDRIVAVKVADFYETDSREFSTTNAKYQFSALVGTTELPTGGKYAIELDFNNGFLKTIRINGLNHLSITESRFRLINNKAGLFTTAPCEVLLSPPRVN